MYRSRNHAVGIGFDFAEVANLECIFVAKGGQLDRVNSITASTGQSPGRLALHLYGRASAISTINPAREPIND
jgi:hypothetical protein